MNKKQERFKLRRFAFEAKNGEIMHRFLITDNKLPMLEPNLWLMTKAIRKPTTSKEYAKKLVKYLNFLDKSNLEYFEATNSDVEKFLNILIYGELNEFKIKTIYTDIVYNTAISYITVVTSFYKWLSSVSIINMKIKTKTKKKTAKNSFLYGQIYEYDYEYLIDNLIKYHKPRRDYIKWYTEDEKETLCNSFDTLRDKAVFLLTLEGFRIDEVLSMKLHHYDRLERTIQPSRSKGKSDLYGKNDNHLRIIALNQQTCDTLNKYIYTERILAENESLKISEYIFINLNRGVSQGNPLSYSNYYKIFKRCAKKAGFNETKIRTHSGRSTKMMEYLEHQALYPEDNLTDEMISKNMGWKSIESSLPYKNFQNPIIARAIADKLHKKRGKYND